MGTRLAMILATLAALGMLFSSYIPPHAQEIQVTLKTMKPSHKAADTTSVAPATLMTPPVPAPLKPAAQPPEETPASLTHSVTVMAGVTFVQDVDIREALSLHLHQDHGVAIASVEQGAPAQKAGVIAGDLLLELDGRSVSSYEEVAAVLSAKSSSDLATLFVLRRNIPVTLTTHLEPLATHGGRRTFPPHPRMGIALRMGDGLGFLRRQLGFEGGLWVSSVTSGSHAESAGIRPSDILLRVNGMVVNSHSDLAQALKEPGTGSADVLRGGSVVFLTLPHPDTLNP